MAEHDAEMDALTQQLITAGLLETFTDADGDEAMRLRPDGEKVARQLALGADEDALLEPLHTTKVSQAAAMATQAAGPSGP
jgi:hypothetical protein